MKNLIYTLVIILSITSLNSCIDTNDLIEETNNELNFKRGNPNELTAPPDEDGGFGAGGGACSLIKALDGNCNVGDFYYKFHPQNCDNTIVVSGDYTINGNSLVITDFHKSSSTSPNGSSISIYSSNYFLNNSGNIQVSLAYKITTWGHNPLDQIVNYYWKTIIINPCSQIIS